jgi:hypothetical protein
MVAKFSYKTSYHYQTQDPTPGANKQTHPSRKDSNNNGGGGQEDGLRRGRRARAGGGTSGGGRHGLQGRVRRATGLPAWRRQLRAALPCDRRPAEHCWQVALVLTSSSYLMVVQRRSTGRRIHISAQTWPSSVCVCVYVVGLLCVMSMESGFLRFVVCPLPSDPFSFLSTSHP